MAARFCQRLFQRWRSATSTACGGPTSTRNCLTRRLLWLVLVRNGAGQVLMPVAGQARFDHQALGARMDRYRRSGRRSGALQRVVRHGVMAHRLSGGGSSITGVDRHTRVIFGLLDSGSTASRRQVMIRHW